jgi:hypothetical protein
LNGTKAMKTLAAPLLFLCLLTGDASAQGCGAENRNCIVPTAPPGSNDNQAASTAFVQQAIGASAPGAAVAANTFLNSLGVDAHVGSFPYTNYVTPMTYLGVRWSRFDDNTSNTSAYLALAAATGIKGSVSTTCNPVSTTITVAQSFNAAGILLAVEGPNEPNNFTATYSGNVGGGWFSWLPIAQCQAALYAASKASLPNTPVWGISETGGEADNVRLQFSAIPAGSSLSTLFARAGSVTAPSASTLTDGAGVVWSFGSSSGSNYQVLRGGTQYGSAVATFMALYDGVIWIETATSQIYSTSSYPPGGGNPLVQLQTSFPSASTLTDGTKYWDYANVHNYTQNCPDLGGASGTGAILDNEAFNAANPTLNGCPDGLYTNYGPLTWGQGFPGNSYPALLTMPRVVTETGWQSGNSITAIAQGKLTVNLALSQFLRGYSYTSFYEVADGEGGGGTYGLFTSSYVAKPAATYFHNLTTVLADRVNFTPVSLSFAISGETITDHHMLLQKSSGQFELCMWGESLYGGSDLTVHFSTRHSQVNVYDVTLGSTPIYSYTNVNSVPVSLSDHALIVEVVG